MNAPLSREQLELIFQDAPADEFCTNYVRADHANDVTLDGHFNLERIAALIGAAYLRDAAKFARNENDHITDNGQGYNGGFHYALSIVEGLAGDLEAPDEC